MTDSPLQFSRDFDRLKGSLAVIHTPDTRLLLLTDFWPKLKEVLEYKSFSSYSDEYFPLILQPVSETDLGDLRVEELRSIIDQLSDIAKSGDADFRAKIQTSIHQTAIALAKKLFYIGEIEEGLEVCKNIVESGSSSGASRSSVGESKTPTPPFLDTAEFERFRQVRDNAKDSSPELNQLLTSILVEWESILESLTTDGANCLFVEKDGSGQAFRGRMMTLEGNVELFGKAAEKDEITFQNQIKTPDDPFIGVAYDALEAVHRLLSGKKYDPPAPDNDTGRSEDQPVTEKRSRPGKSGPFYHAHFTILNSKQTFTGDSIGLAFSLITYTQLLKPEIMRQERFLPSGVAFTGGVDEDGRLTPVNEDTLRLKIERAFFSPMKFLVVPVGNFAAAKGFIEEFRRKYPRRNLRLISAESLNEILEDRNVIRSERVCMGQFVLRKASRYTRSAKIQIPILLALLYAAVCLIYPKVWVGFDWNPTNIVINMEQKSAEMRNGKGQFIWSRAFSTKIADLEPQLGLMKLYDLNDDGKNEVLMMAFTFEDCPERDRLFCYSNDGDSLLFERYCGIIDQYPNDTAGVLYAAEWLNVIEIDGKTVIVTEVGASMPSRSQIRFWDAKGDSIGWYINAGGSSYRYQSDLNHDGREEIYFSCYNNRMACASFLALHPDSAGGCSPPYRDSGWDLSGIKRGNQTAYILFPFTDVGHSASPQPYNQPSSQGVRMINSSLININITEYDGPYATLADIEYNIDRRMRVVDVWFTDSFRKLRNDLINEGANISKVDWATYQKQITEAVTYWTDSGWVTEGQLRAAEAKLK